MTPHDASGYAEVQVAAWRATYAGIMSAEYLRDLDRDQVAARVRERLPDFPAAHKPTRALVATLAGRVVGIAAVGRASDAGNDFPSGQLWMINVHPDVWGTGVGTDLHSFALRVLLALGHREAYLWVARANARARRFYEREGWLATGVEQRENIGGAAVPEVMYRRRLD
jgi:GNAT superfamily N-acetyltransferase